MEKLFHYVWKHRLFNTCELSTTAGEAVELIDVGLHNHDAGPDFFNAKVKIAGQMWVGNVEVHLRSSQWTMHGHDADPAYNYTILHVVCVADCEVWTESGRQLPQLVVDIPVALRNNYEHLLTEDRFPRCYKHIPNLSTLMLHSWLSHLSCERLERKATDILQRVERSAGSWEDAFFQTLARNFGFGVNADAFELWARSLPLHAVAHHRDDLMQVEALFYGQAGMTSREEYSHLDAEYRFLAHKFGLAPIESQLWRFLRMRPQNFPTVRIGQLARLYHEGVINFSRMIDCVTVQDVVRALKGLSKPTALGIALNTVVPLLFAYGRATDNEELTQRAIDMLDSMPAEDNTIVRLWRECSLTVDNAADSQALIQLKKEYCDRKDCLRCRIGYNVLKSQAQLK